MEDINELLSNAKLGCLVKGSRFISSVVFSLTHSFSTEIPTACTNGTRVLYNPDFFLSLAKEERVFLILHETWHVVFLHILRRSDRDPKLWNYAGDFVINLILIDAGFKMPKGGLLNRGYKGLSTEEIYDLLEQDPPKDSPEFSPEDLEESAISTEEQEKLKVQVKQILNQASVRSKLSNEQGAIPGEIERLIDQLNNPKLPWTELLQRFLSDRVKDDWNWKRPNRRYLSQDLILPSQFSEALGHIAVAIDTSGSVTQEELTELLSELRYIHTKFKPQKMTIMDCDWKIHNTYEIESSDEILDLTFNGGGGTQFEPVFEALKGKPIEALIYFTDLEAKPITEAPDYPVLWICSSNHEPALIGETIYLD